MNGKLTIECTEGSVKVVGSLSGSSFMDRVFIVDALMNAFDMKGPRRTLVCDMLESVEQAKDKMSSKDIETILDRLFEALTSKDKESTKYEG